MQDALRWALQIAEALAYLHQFLPLIVHRDLKLENILLTSPVPSHADAKLADFGLHKMIKVRLSMLEFCHVTRDQSVTQLTFLLLHLCKIIARHACKARRCARQQR